MLRYRYRLLEWLFIFNSIAINTSSQEYDSIVNLNAKRTKHIFSVSAGIQHGFIFAHSRAVQNTKGANPTGVEVIFGWQRNDRQTWDLCNCFPKKGLLLAYYDYDVKLLGKSFSAAYYLEPFYKLSNRSFFFSKAWLDFPISPILLTLFVILQTNLTARRSELICL